MSSKEVQSKIKEIMRTRLHEVVVDGGVLHDVGNVLVSSITKNFRVHGRYSNENSFEGGQRKWKPVTSATARAKRKRKRNPDNVLQDTGQLMQSITYRAVAGRIYVGSNKRYAAIHQYGGIVKVGAYNRDVKFIIKKSGVQFAKSSATGKNVFTKNVKYPARTFKIQARPFVVVQKDDKELIAKIIGKKFVFSH